MLAAMLLCGRASKEQGITGRAGEPNESRRQSENGRSGMGGHAGRACRTGRLRRVSRCRTMTGSRRHAGKVLGGRRRGKRPRSPEDEGRWTTGDGVAGGHGRPRTTKAPSAKGGLRRTVAKATTHACEGRKKILRTETGCCVQDRRRETKQLYALAAVRAKRTQQSLRACPNDRAQT